MPTIRRPLYVSVVLALFLAPRAYPQYSIVSPPATYGDPDLRGISVGYTIPVLCDGAGESMDAWASSFLEAEGKPPVKPASTGDEDIDMEAESDYSREYALWASMYSSLSAADSDAATAWAEGAKGPGIGEVVIVKVLGLEGLGIRAGFQKNADLYSKNARPRKVRVWALAAGHLNIGQYYNYYEDVKALTFIDSELDDVMDWQPLYAPSVKAPATTISGTDDTADTAWFVAVQILSVYPGSKWEDCCITEIGIMQ